MPIFHILRETPEGSGTFVDTGETAGEEVSAEQAIARAIALSAEGGRHAIYPYETMRIVPVPVPEPEPEPEPVVVEPFPMAPEPMQDTVQGVFIEETHEPA